MATFSKAAKGWRVQVAVSGVRESKTFSTKAEATSWAAKRETEIRADAGTGIERGRTLDDAFRRYEKEVSAHKKGKRSEVIRLAAIGRMEIDGVALQDMKLADITPAVLGAWRDQRLKKVLGSSVNRDLNLLSHVFATAAKEWKWIAKSPTTDVRRPKDPPPRERLYTKDEIDRLCLALGLDVDSGAVVQTKYEQVAIAFLFAIETAMRAGEICSVTPAHVTGRVVKLTPDITKNGTSRSVPLSKAAVALLARLPAPGDRGTMFDITAASLDAIFRKVRTRAAVDAATFHDTRHLAITRLAKKVDVLDLARMVGHRDLKQLLVYYNESADKTALKLD
jgi:integrase